MCVVYSWISPHPNLPPEACDIASYVQVLVAPVCVGVALFLMPRHSRRKTAWAMSGIQTPHIRRRHNDGGSDLITPLKPRFATALLRTKVSHLRLVMIVGSRSSKRTTS